MDFNIQKERICLCETAFQGSSEQAVDCDITLPEYLPDIVKILRCSLIPGVKSHQINGDRITAECCCLVRVLYICDEGKMHCFEQNLQFAKQIEIKSSENSTEFFVGSKSDYVNYRVSGQRRFEIHGAVTIFAKSSSKKKIEPVTDAGGDGITIKSEKCDVCDLISTVERSFTVAETCDAGALSEPMGAIVSSCGWGVIDELKIVSNKLFLKGELIVHTAFTGTETHEVETLENIVNINQIIEAPEITDTCHIDAYLSLICLQVKPRFDLSGNKNLLDIEASLCLSVCGYETRNLSIVKDAYSVKYETDIKKSVVYLASIQDEIEDTFLCRGDIDLSATGCTKVLSFMCTDITSGFALLDNSCTIQGEVTADIIYEDVKGEICYITRQIPYEYKKPSGVIDGILSCTPKCSISAFSFVINSGNSLDVRIEINIRGFVFNEKERLITTDLAVNHDKVKEIKTASLTVYFAEKDESLWGIAEKYNTTVERIMGENKLTEAYTTDKCKLLIPKM